MSTKNLKYDDAITELEQILESVESGKLGVDDLTGKVKRASQLIKFCREKLYKTEQDIDKILEEIEED
ncbi:MAG: exodeoxyribonuclease VII small subunit [Bacteroidales bacterium]|nr:exodeoxyribonuclease VII small subunit [Bacteroidales bacterium]